MVDGDFKNSSGDNFRNYHSVVLFDFAGFQRAVPTSMLSIDYY